MEENNMAQTELSGKTEAVASLVLGVLSLCLCAPVSILSLILGIVGLVFAGQAKRMGFRQGIRTAGFVTSLLGVIFGGLFVLVAVAAGGILFTVGAKILRDIVGYVFL